MDKILVTLGLKFISRKLDGKKTIFGAVLLMIMGLGKILYAAAGTICLMFPDLAATVPMQPLDTDAVVQLLEVGGGMFGAGLAALGIGHKIEKTAVPGGL